MITPEHCYLVLTYVAGLLFFLAMVRLVRYVDKRLDKGN